jgi:membrane glycosyltransferase
MAAALNLREAKTRFAGRRLAFVALLATTIAALGLSMLEMLRQNGTTWLEVCILALSMLLLVPIVLSFWLAFFGFLAELRGGDPLALDLSDVAASGPPLLERIAIVMPVYDEDPRRVSAGLRACYESLEATGHLAEFDFFLLSDTLDPGRWLEEEIAFARLRASVSRPERLHYRNRARNLEKKAGNIADFCARWGDEYACMVVLDADSVMSGETLLRLARAMEAHPRIGILQAPPLPVNSRSLFGRLQQFASRAYGPTWTAGLAWLAGGESNYYGHNAILRVAPFIEHCRLPRLPGKPPLGGSILSHDFVEAALMRRAGFRTCFALGLRGSYEELPPTLIDYAARDRRWCQGNLQHALLLGMPGLHTMNRAHFAIGVMGYASAPVWLLLLLLWTAETLRVELTPHEYFPADGALFPQWQESTLFQALTLLALVLALLFVPRVLAIVSRLRRREERRGFGGARRLLASVALEWLLSTLLAPVMMLEHARFVVGVLFGKSVGWKAQRRGERGVRMREAVRRHGAASALGAAWGLLLLSVAPRLLGWMLPVLLGLLLAIPLSLLTGRVDLGQWARTHGLLGTPEERNPEPVLRRLRELVAESDADLDAPEASSQAANALERVLANDRLRELHLALHVDDGAAAPADDELESLVLKCRLRGVETLTAEEQRRILRQPRAVLELAADASSPRL